MILINAIYVQSDTYSSSCRHFQSEPVDEDQILQSFFMSGMQAANSLSKFDKKRKRAGGGGVGGGGGGGGLPYNASSNYGGGGGGGAYLPRGKEARQGQVARVDEEVAAR